MASKAKTGPDESDINEIIVTGYIRSIQSILQNAQIIPEALYHLCYVFYRIQSPTIFWCRRVYDMFDIAALNFKNKTISNIGLTISKTASWRTRVHSLCHIPNMSYYFSNNITNGNKCHGILYAYTTSMNLNHINISNPYINKPYLRIILYDNTFENCYEYSINNMIPLYSFNKFLYFKDTIIYEHNQQIYKLYLPDIKSYQQLSNFVSIKQNNTVIQNNTAVQNTGNKEYFNMTYLPDKHSLFAVSCTHEPLRRILTAYQYEARQAQCGIFNMNDNVWMKVPLFHYRYQTTSKEFYCETCYDGSNCVYLYTDCVENFQSKGLSKYDMSKNKWYEINQNKCHKLNIIWIDNNILYGFCSPSRKNAEFKRYSLDLRDNTAQWIIEDYMFDTAQKEKNQYFSFFK